jgi:GntR family transcriptional regulator, transcriptional repressor for pyruvate dehydrogenase complex
MQGLVSKTVRAVHDLIHAEGLRTGEALPSETALALRFGVSRAVIREAFRSLAALKLIDLGTGRRARVAAPDGSVLALVLDHSVHIDQTSVQQILDVRRTIELRTVVLATLRRTDQEAASIAALAQAMDEDFHESARVMKHDIAFHEAIAVASKNPLFALIVGAFHVVTRQTWPIGWATRASDDDRRANVACHIEIARAITATDPRRAEKAMAEHFDNSVKVLLAAGIN